MINQAVIILVSVLMALTTQGTGSQITIKIDLQSEAKGLVQLLLFKGEKGFPDQSDEAVLSASARVENGKAIFKFSNLDKGTYAVAAFHDGNEDGEMRKTLLGIPKDAYGFSNNARGTFSAPSFESASFELPEGSHTISFILK
ncbi:DUF2141 domain-containing protein [Cyclobacterium amurskyense]|uniref:DUF2141 domain-containing protein n=1 Tax=Cyclobacterium amurskyense TaxID=320787 RepID=A0A0H4PM62_9BACT|nr:DUF2141 domain-containing protein [Cyclobacterium amurskyense]AKP54135.1 hypothetical protein CA2015_4811 [Cyclobacterium amurskyense]|tara:strand:+ start:8358 stop:8786 length:429 start_codon:yes stop_codon:yes gene_type:complete